MKVAFDLFFATTAPAGAAEAVAQLSDLELMARYPALAGGAGLVFGLGLLCDAYLLWRWRGPQKATAAPATPWLKVPPKPWGTSALGFAAGLLLLVFVSTDLLLTLAAKLGRLEEDAGWSLLLTGEMMLRLGLLLGALAYARRHRLDWQQALGLRALSRLKGIAAGAVGYFAVLPPLALVMAVSTPLCRLIGIKPSAQFAAELLASSDSLWVVGLIAVFAILVAPLFEEVVFRGFAYPALKQRWGTGRALVIISVVFALIHLHAPSIAPLFALSVALALAYELTGSLLAPITMHALFNAANVLMLLYVRAHS